MEFQLGLMKTRQKVGSMQDNNTPATIAGAGRFAVISDRLYSALLMLMPGTCGVFFLLTYPLWLGTSSFPQIPFVAELRGVSNWLPQLCFCFMSVTLMALIKLGWQAWRCDAAQPLTRALRLQIRLALVVFIAALAVSVLHNQHRLQPWTYHFLILAVLLWPGGAESQRGESRRLKSQLVVLTASIYVWSAWSKLDAQFVQTYGRQFVETMLNAVGLSTRFWSPTAQTIAAASLPVGELLVGLLMLWRRTRVVACALSWLMHLGLMLAVGPLGFNHLPGVLLWNVFFMVQNFLLAGYERAAEPLEPTPVGRLSDAKLLRNLFVGVVVLLPLLHEWGRLDHWPAWAVYSARTEKVTVAVEESAIDRLPAEIQPFLEVHRLQTGWRFIRIERWSLAAVGAPIYPDDRFAIGVALEIGERARLDDELQVVWQAPVGSGSRDRPRVDLRNRQELQRFAEGFRLNALAQDPDGYGH